MGGTHSRRADPTGPRDVERVGHVQVDPQPCCLLPEGLLSRVAVVEDQ